MSSLHTRYRPTTFGGVRGQDDIVRSLERVVKEGRAHTFLLTGPSGTGKTTLARITAGEIAGSISPYNLIEVDAATHSRAEDMRAVIATTRFRAMGASPVKTVIVDECHRLSSAAWTILLKPIEEPPEYVYYFFCTTEPGKVPKTILTRCLRYDLKLVDEISIYELLLTVTQAENFNFSEDVLEVIAERAGGSPRQALVYLEACHYAKTAAEAHNVIGTGSQMKKLIDLARLPIAKHATWQSALKIINNLDGVAADAVRTIVVNHITCTLAKSRSDDDARLLYVLDCFSEPYKPADELAPLLTSIGRALGPSP